MLMPYWCPIDASSLLHGHVDEVLIFQPKLLGRVVWRDALAIHHEANLRGLHIAIHPKGGTQGNRQGNLIALPGPN